MIRLLLWIPVLLAGLACEKATVKAPGDQLVEIYALEYYQRVQNKCQVDASTAVLKANPVIHNDEILSYSKSSHEFQLTDQGKQAAASFIDHYVFAVTVNKEVVYYGFFKLLTSSSSCDHSLTMNIAYPSGNLSMELGYPGPMQGVTIDDQRNNSKLLAALETQGKLTN